MAAFYGDTLGLKPIGETRTDAWVEFDAGSARLALHAIPPQIRDRIEISSPARAREENPVKLIFAVGNVELELARLEVLGIRMLPRASGACDGIDPEGNVFRIRSQAN